MARRVKRRGDQFEQSHHVRAGDGPRLFEQAGVALGRHAQLLGDLLQQLDGEQLPAVDLEVADQLARIAARRSQPPRDAQRLGGVMRDHGVDRLEQLLGIGNPEHSEHVGR